MSQNNRQHLTPPAKITFFYLAARQAGPGHPSVAIPCFHGGKERGKRGFYLLLLGEVELLYNSERKSGLEKTTWGDECRGKVEEAEEIPATCSHKGVL